MKRFKTIAKCALLATCAALIVPSSSVFAALIAYDGFVYNTGSLGNQNGGSGWSTVWYQCNAADINVASNSLGYTSSLPLLSLVTSGNQAQQTTSSNNNDQRQLNNYYGPNCGNPVNQTVWISFTAQSGGAVNSNGYAGISLFDSGQTGLGCSSAEYLFIGKRGGAAHADWGAEQSAGTGCSTCAGGDSGIVFNGTTHFLVARLDFTSAGLWTIHMWVDPSLASVPLDNAAGVVTFNFTDNVCFNRFRIQAGLGSTINVDELRMGTTYGDVSPVIAPSVTIAPSPSGPICAGTSVAFTATPANGGANPVYTWYINGVQTQQGTAATYTSSAFHQSDQVWCTITQDSTIPGSQSNAVSSGTNTISVTTLSLAPIALPNVSIGALYNQTVSGSGGTGPYTYSVTAGALPSGLILSNSTGVISGTYTGGAGSATFTIQATDQGGIHCAASRQYAVLMSSCPSITVSPSILPVATVGAPYNQTISATGGVSPYLFIVSSGNLLAGLVLSSAGTLSGTPTATGSSTFTVLANDANGCSGTQSYTLMANCPVISLSPTNLPGGTATVAYNQTITGSGGTSPYTFAMIGGSLPSLVTLGTNGTVSGTPTVTGTFNITVRVTDHYGCAANQACSLVINCPTISMSPTNLAPGTTGAVYGSTTILANGGVGPYTFSVTSGSPPAGLTLSTAGMLSGTPTNSGSSTFVVQVKDTNNCTGVQSYTVSICGPPTITQQPAPLTVCGGSTASFTASANGTGPLTYAWRQHNTGWGDAWSFSAQNSPIGSGIYIGSSTNNGFTGDPGHDGDIDTGGEAWGLYANSSNTVSAVRLVNLAVGQTFRIDMDVGDIPPPGVVGFQLFYGGTPRFGFQFIGGQQDFTINDSISSQRDSGVPYTTQGLHIALTLLDADHYSMTVTAAGTDGPSGGPWTITGAFVGSPGSVVNRLRLYNFQVANDANNPKRDAFFNSISFGAYDDNALNYTNATWAGDGGSAPLSDGGDLSGSGTPTLTVSNVSPADAANYDVAVYNDCGFTTSAVVPLRLDSNTPVIVTQPQNETVCPGVGATFSVSATGVALYQWRRNGIELTDGGSISGSASSNLTINPVGGNDDQTTYDALLIGPTGCSVDSSVEALTVTANVTIQQQPQSQMACSSGNASFSVTANVGSGLTYQWIKNGTNIFDGGTVSGSATPTLNLAGLTLADSGASFSVSVSAAGCRSANSTTATLTVNAAPAITNQPADVSLCTSGNPTFTVGATGSGLTYRWQKNTTPLADGGTVSGSATATLTLTGVGVADNGASFNCVVSGIAPCTSVTSGPGRLNIVLPPAVTAQPSAQTTCDGWNTSFTVTANNPASYQWRKNGVALSNGGSISGATSNTLVLTGTHIADSGADFDVIVVGNSPCASATSTVAALTVNALPSISVQPQGALTVCSNSPANFSVTAAGNGVNYQWRKRGVGWASGWVLTANANAALAGFYVGSSTSNNASGDTNGDGDIDTGGRAWAMYANTSNLTEARRLSSTPLAVGQTVGIDIDNGTVVIGALAGFSLRAGGDTGTNNQFELYADGTSGDYLINENDGVSNGPVNTTIPLTTEGLRVVFTLTGTNTFSMSFTRLSDGSVFGPFTGNLLGTGGIDRIRPFIYNPGTGGVAQDFFFNNITFGANSDSAADSVYGHGGSPDLLNGDNGGGSNITGATSSTYTIASVQPSDAGSYDVLVGGTCRPAMTSSAAVLSATSLCLTVTQPLDGSYTTNATVTVLGTASGATGVKVNNNAATSVNGFANWIATVSGLAVGTNQLTAVATNNVGGIGTNISYVIYATGSYDGNGDGLPDAWQLQYFGCVTCPQAAPGADPDGCGISNLQEFLAGTDPTDCASAFRITSIVAQGNDMRVTWTCGSGRTNVLQATSSLLASYSNISQNIMLNGSSTNYLDIGAATNTVPRFYRVRLVP